MGFSQDFFPRFTDFFDKLTFIYLDYIKYMLKKSKRYSKNGF